MLNNQIPKHYQKRKFKRQLGAAYKGVAENVVNVLENHNNNPDYLEYAFDWAADKGYLNVVKTLLTSKNLALDLDLDFRKLALFCLKTKALDLGSNSFAVSALLYQSIPHSYDLLYGLAVKEISENLPRQKQGLLCAYYHLTKRNGIPRDISHSILRSTPLGYALMPPANMAGTGPGPFHNSKKQRVS